ncbi:hypothetical protein [Pseudolysinimonas sp.]
MAFALEDGDLGPRHLGDEYEGVQSVLQIRRELADLIDQAKPGKQLEMAIRGIRAACRSFLTAAGRDGVRFRQSFHMPGDDPFTRALTELRVLVGIQIGLVATYYSKVVLTPEHAEIVPNPDEDSNDIDWVADQVL